MWVRRGSKFTPRRAIASVSGTKIIWTNLQGQMMLRSIANIISNNFQNQVSLISTIVFPFYYPIINIHPSKMNIFYN